MTTRITHADLGAPGPAARARPATFFSPEGRARGTTNSERVEVVRYLDAELYDRMHARAQLSDRAHETLQRLHQMWTAAGHNPRVSASLELMSGVETPFEEPVARNKADPDHPTARDMYRRLMTMVPGEGAMRIDDVLMGNHPGWKLATLAAAVDWVADYWGVEKR